MGPTVYWQQLANVKTRTLRVLRLLAMKRCAANHTQRASQNLQHYRGQGRESFRWSQAACGGFVVARRQVLDSPLARRSTTPTSTLPNWAAGLQKPLAASVQPPQFAPSERHRESLSSNVRSVAKPNSCCLCNLGRRTHRHRAGCHRRHQTRNLSNRNARIAFPGRLSRSYLEPPLESHGIPTAWSASAAVPSVALGQLTEPQSKVPSDVELGDARPECDHPAGLASVKIFNKLIANMLSKPLAPRTDEACVRFEGFRRGILDPEARFQ